MSVGKYVVAEHSIVRILQMMQRRHGSAIWWIKNAKEEERQQRIDLEGYKKEEKLEKGNFLFLLLYIIISFILLIYYIN